MKHQERSNPISNDKNQVVAPKGERYKRLGAAIALTAAGALAGSAATAEVVQSVRSNDVSRSEAITIAQHEVAKKESVDQFAALITKSLNPSNILPNAGTFSMDFLAGIVSMQGKDGISRPAYADPIILSEIKDGKTIGDLTDKGTVYLGMNQQDPDGSFKIRVELYDPSYMQFTPTDANHQIVKAGIYAQPGKDGTSLFAFDPFAQKTPQQPNGNVLTVGEYQPLK